MVLVESLYNKVKKGDPGPGFSLPGIDGKTHTLEEHRGKRAILVVFMCNHCPYVKHKIKTIVSLHRDFHNQGLQVIGINSNDASQYPDDSPEKMKEFAAQEDIAFPYLVDETQDVARSWGASCTPDPYLLDSQLRLVYHGRFDDASEPGSSPTTAEIRDAIQQLVAGQEVIVKEQPSIGCSIKWKQSQ